MIDLYYLHRVDPNVAIEDVAGQMQRFIEEGKIRAWDLSEAGPVTITKAHAVCLPAALQSEYSMMWREPETRMMPVLNDFGMTLTAFSPLGKGFLSGKVTSQATFGADDFRSVVPRFEAANLKANQLLVDYLNRLAQEKHRTQAQIALAWVLAQGKKMIPIPGTKNPARLKENVGALEVVISENELSEINEKLASIPIAGDRYPAAFAKRVAP